PWTYGADENMKKLRLRVLESKNKASDRYLLLRKKYLDSILIHCEELYPEISLSDNAIEALDTLSSGRKSIRYIQFFSQLSKKDREKYINFKDSHHFSELLAKY